jgi:hypothetical protein
MALFMRSPQYSRLETMPFEGTIHVGTFVQPLAVVAFEPLSDLFVVCRSKKLFNLFVDVT